MSNSGVHELKQEIDASPFPLYEVFKGAGFVTTQKGLCKSPDRFLLLLWHLDIFIGRRTPRNVRDVGNRKLNYTYPLVNRHHREGLPLTECFGPKAEPQNRCAADKKVNFLQLSHVKMFEAGRFTWSYVREPWSHVADARHWMVRILFLKTDSIHHNAPFDMTLHDFPFLVNVESRSYVLTMMSSD